jgi:agmatinase
MCLSLPRIESLNLVYVEDHTRFTCAHDDYENSDAVIVGIPFDGTTSHFPGARFGPVAIRQASWSVETFSPEIGRDLLNYDFCDIQDIAIYGTQSELFANIRSVAYEITTAGKFLISLGGEHSVTHPIVQGISDALGELAVINFDAHLDLRDEYLGNHLSHASVMRRCLEVTPHLYHFGARSGAAEEWELADHYHVSRKLPDSEDIKAVMDTELPLYLTIDIDVLDPAFAPGTGSPEPGGVTTAELMDSIHALGDIACNLVGCDIMEVCPPCDHGSLTAIVAARIVRDILLISLG